jgi:hypothetical protein
LFQKIPTRSGAVYNSNHLSPSSMSDHGENTPRAGVSANPDGSEGGVVADAADGGHGAPTQVLPNPPHAVSVDANAVNPSVGRMIDFRPSLPKDAIGLLKFRSDADLSTLEDFVFRLELYFDAVPRSYEVAVNPDALRNQFVVVVVVVAGCFPPGSVSAVWFRSLYKAGIFSSWHVFFAAHV